MLTRENPAPVKKVDFPGAFDYLKALLLRESVAQLVEQRPFKPWVAGSIPARLTIFLFPR